MGKRSRVACEVSEDVAAPFVAYFPTGNPSTEAAGKDMEFSVYEGKGKMGRGLLVGTKGHVDYVGKTLGDEYTGPQPCTYAVGVYDKSSGKLQLLPVQWGKVLRLEARLRNLKYGPTGAGSEYEAAETHEERRAENKRLVDSFGSTRRRRQLVAMEEGRVHGYRLGATEHLADVVNKGAEGARAAGLTKEEVMKKATSMRILPPHHPEATCPADAYRLKDIIPREALSRLMQAKLYKASETPSFLETLQKEQVPDFPAYVLSRVHLLTHSDRDLAKHRADALGFLAVLIKLNDAKPVLYASATPDGFENICERMSIDSSLLARLLEIFYVHSAESNKDKWERPDGLQVLLISYILVVATLVELDEAGRAVLGVHQFEALRKQLKMGTPELVSRFREIGATPTSVVEKSGDGAVCLRSYSISLLSDKTQGAKTLGTCFPGLKILKRAKK